MMTHYFTKEIADVVGIPAAVIFENIKNWVAKNEANDTNFHDGRYWTYNSVNAFSQLFSYMTAKQIRLAIEKLKEAGLIITANYNTSAYDRTLWYALSDKAISMFLKSKIDLPFRENGNALIGEPIPDNKPNNKPDNKPNINNKEYDISTLHSDISNKKDEPSLDTIDLPEVNPGKDRAGKDSIGKDTDKSSIPKVPYERIKDLYNSICTSLPKCTLVSEKRKISIKAVTSKFQIDQIEEAFGKAQASDFLTGRAKNGWSGCSFDWLMNTNNMLKVLEGNYDNRGKNRFTEDDFVLE